MPNATKLLADNKRLQTETDRLRELLQLAVSYQPVQEDGLLWYGFTPEFDARVQAELRKKR